MDSASQPATHAAPEGGIAAAEPTLREKRDEAANRSYLGSRAIAAGAKTPAAVEIAAVSSKELEKERREADRMPPVATTTGATATMTASGASSTTNRRGIPGAKANGVAAAGPSRSASGSGSVGWNASAGGSVTGGGVKKVNELIGGRVQEVFVLESSPENDAGAGGDEDDWLSAPPSRPLGPEDATYASNTAITTSRDPKGKGKGKALPTAEEPPPMLSTRQRTATSKRAAIDAANAATATSTATSRGRKRPAAAVQDSADRTPTISGTNAAEDQPAAKASRTAASGTMRSGVGAARYDDPSWISGDYAVSGGGPAYSNGSTGTTARRKRPASGSGAAGGMGDPLSAADAAALGRTSFSGSARGGTDEMGGARKALKTGLHDQAHRQAAAAAAGGSGSGAMYASHSGQGYAPYNAQQQPVPTGVTSKSLMTTGRPGEAWPTNQSQAQQVPGATSTSYRYVPSRLSRSLAETGGSVGAVTQRDSVLSVASPVAPSPPPAGLPIDDPEGHFIVRPGDSITPRYKILSQLGQGTFGKVVECYDRSERRRVAIKVIRAIQKYRDASQIEIRVLRTLREHDPTNENQCIHLLSTFSYRNHVCIVSELLGKSVFDFLKENQFHPFPSTHIWSFAKQLLKSVACEYTLIQEGCPMAALLTSYRLVFSVLHSLNLVHTDLKPENILLVDSEYVSKPYSSRYPNSKKWRILKNTEIRLIDFGSATFDNEYHSAVVSTRHYRAPEIILGMGWSFPCDVWSIGCILVEFHTGDALFQTHDNLEHLAMMEAVLGIMPDDFRRKAETYKADLFQDGHLDYPNAKTNKTSKKYVRSMRKLSVSRFSSPFRRFAGVLMQIARTQDVINYSSAYNKHNTRFLHLLRRLLEFDPDKRITVQQALQHPYFHLHANEFPP